MIIEGTLFKGHLEERINRYLASVNIDGNTILCFVPNPGRMLELLIPGKKVVLKEAGNKNRKTSYDLIGVYHEGQIVSIDSRVPNKLTYEALKDRKIPELDGYETIKKEYSYGKSRLDFLLSNGSERCLLEVKSGTLVENKRALFPDAPTERGRRHLRELIQAKKEGMRACVLFIIQRIDAEIFSPNDITDPEFGKVLRHAEKEGVEIFAYTSEFKDNSIILKDKIRIDIKYLKHQ